MIFCTVFDSQVVIERFPLTEDGWRQAWQALALILHGLMAAVGRCGGRFLGMDFRVWV